MKFLKKIDFGHVLEKSSILVKISEKCGFFSEISKKFLFCQKKKFRF